VKVTEMEVLFPGGQRVNARYGDLVIETDQEGAAPAPYHLFLASLATCAGIYVLSFFQKRGLSTEGLRMDTSFHRDSESGLLRKCEIDIKLPPGFPAKYRRPVIRAAELCSVARALLAPDPPEFTVRASEAEG